VIGCGADSAPDGPTKAPRQDASTVVGTVAGQSITMGQIEEAAAGGLIRVEQQRYDVLRAQLEQMGMRMLLEAAAEEQGISAEELELAEIEGKVVDPTPEEIERAYAANPDRSRGRSLDELYQPIFNTMRRDRLALRTVNFYNELKDKYGFSVSLDPPRIDMQIAESEQARGPVDAPITIVEYGDFECPFCRQAHATLERLLTDYRGQIRYIFRDFPLSSHARAIPASEASYCAAEQDKYWDYFEHLMVMAGDLNDNDLRRRAEEVGLDVGTFMSCFTSGRHTAAIQANFNSGVKVGVASTPTFYINGRVLTGAKNYETFKLIIEEELAASGG
jgi:predicted DsbA family dithiol-disulfide isomerase